MPVYNNITIVLEMNAEIKINSFAGEIFTLTDGQEFNFNECLDTRH